MEEKVICSYSKNYLTCLISLSKDSNAQNFRNSIGCYISYMSYDVDINFDPLAATLFLLLDGKRFIYQDSNSLDQYGRLKGKKSSSYS